MRFSEFLNNNFEKTGTMCLNEGILNWIKNKFFKPKSETIKKFANSTLLDSFAKRHLLLLFYDFNLLSVTLGSSMYELTSLFKERGGDLKTFKHTLVFGVPEELSKKSLSRIVKDPIKVVKEFIAENLVNKNFEVGYSKTLGRYPSECDLRFNFEIEGNFELNPVEIKTSISKIIEKNFKNSENLGSSTLNNLGQVLGDDEFRSVIAPKFYDMVDIDLTSSKLEGYIMLHCFCGRV